ncbi:carbohydrate binding family 9 domain-containing protein [Myxococcaceae bacterium GXIMD 01537]
MNPSIPGWRWGVALLAVCLPVLAHADSTYNAKATFTAEPITIDGKLDEPAWQNAPELSGWYLTRINYGSPVEDDTKVRILYDKDNIYFALHCLDREPNKITAYTVQNEAFLRQEDNITIILDTFLDHRNAYYFWTNPLGVRTDGRIVGDGEAFSTNWAGEWESKATIREDGWLVEVRIPFANFQFPEQEEVTFGLLLDREQARNQKWSNWTPDGVNSAKVSRYPHLTGLKGIRSRKPWSITPYVSTEVGIKKVGEQNTFRPNVGVDARVDPTPWLAVKLTVNPDFAQVEADQDRLLFDQEEPLLPERRPFFVESEQLFLSTMNLFTSRSIARRPHDRVYVGAQVVGKVGRTGFALLDVQHRDGLGDGTYEDVNSGAVRIQQDLGDRSHINVTALSRKGTAWFGTLGVDANIHLFEEVFVQAQASKAWSPGRPADSDAYRVTFHRFDTLSEFWIQLDDIGKSYFNPLSYTPVIDKQGWNTHLYLNPFPGWRFLPRLDVVWDTLWRRNHEHVKTRYRQRLNVQPYLHHNFSLYFDGVYDDNEGFRNRILSAGFTLFPNDWQNFTLTAVGGRFLGGDMRGLTGALNFKLGPRFAAKLTGFYTKTTGVPAHSDLYGTSGDGYTWSGYGQLRYQFSPDLYARVTFQHGRAVELADYNNVKGTLLDATIGWHYRQWSDVYLVYTDQPFNGSQERRLLSKISFTY